MTASPKLPPQNQEAETSVLGAILLSDRALDGLVLDAGLKPDQFYRERHRLIFRAMLRLTDRAAPEPVDVLTVCEELDRAGELEEAGGTAYVHSLPNLVPAAGNARHYAKIVKEHAMLRNLLAEAREIQEQVFSFSGEPRELLDRAQAKLFRIGDERRPGATLEQRQHNLVDHVEGGEVATFPWPFPTLQEMTGGLWPGQFTVIVAITSWGKSVLLDQVLEHVRARGPKLRIGLYLNEMSALERDLRHVARHADIPLKRLMLAKLRDGEAAKFATAVSALPARSFEIVPAAGMTAAEIARDMRRQQWDLMGLDLLNGLPGSSRTEDIDENVRTLVTAANETGCHVIACQHPNRNRFDRAYPPEPSLGDIRGSGQIADLANNVILLYRHEREELHGDGGTKVTGEPGPEGFLNLAKARNGNIGKVDVVFQGSRMRFVEPAPPGTVAEAAA